MEAESDKPIGLEKPSGATKPPPEPVIHVIPDQFYGAALKKRVPIEAPKVAAPLKKEAAAPAPPPPKKGGKAVLIVIGIILVLGAVGASVYFFLLAPKTKPIKPTPTPTPTVAVCGNGTCETGETSSSCAADCPLAAAVCGNGTCDSGETSSSCPDDCKEAAAPVCGDGKCDSEETFSDCPSDCQPPEPQPAPDSDSDGLTDIEERDIFGTDPNNPDTDGDTFVDLNEVLNLFDPTKAPPASLYDSSRWQLYTSASQGYEVLHPVKWTPKESDQGKQVIFTADTGEFIEVLAEDNPSGKLLMDWYLDAVPGKKSSEVSMFRTHYGYDEILSDDRLTAYIAAGTRIFVVAYNLGAQSEIRYKATFQVMVQSLKVK